MSWPGIDYWHVIIQFYFLYFIFIFKSCLFTCPFKEVVGVCLWSLEHIALHQIFCLSPYMQFDHNRIRTPSQVPISCFSQHSHPSAVYSYFDHDIALNKVWKPHEKLIMAQTFLLLQVMFSFLLWSYSLHSFIPVSLFSSSLTYFLFSIPKSSPSLFCNKAAVCSFKKKSTKNPKIFFKAMF